MTLTQFSLFLPSTLGFMGSGAKIGETEKMALTDENHRKGNALTKISKQKTLASPFEWEYFHFTTVYLYNFQYFGEILREDERVLLPSTACHCILSFENFSTLVFLYFYELCNFHFE